MILDQLADLKSYAAQASSAAVTLTKDAALADVEGQIALARSAWVDLGIARPGPLQLVGETERQRVLDSAGQMKQALEALAGATDEELAVFASTTAEKRGSLLAISRQATALKGALIAAQQALLLDLGEKIWPETELLRLDVVGYLTDNPTMASTARRVAAVRQRLADRVILAYAGLSETELNGLIDAATRAIAEAQPLRLETIDNEVLEFWQAADSESGALLSKLTPAVQAWLVKHDALNSFEVRRKR